MLERKVPGPFSPPKAAVVVWGPDPAPARYPLAVPKPVGFEVQLVPFHNSVASVFGCPPNAKAKV